LSSAPKGCDEYIRVSVYTISGANTFARESTIVPVSTLDAE